MGPPGMETPQRRKGRRRLEIQDIRRRRSRVRAVVEQQETTSQCLQQAEEEQNPPETGGEAATGAAITGSCWRRLAVHPSHQYRATAVSVRTKVALDLTGFPIGPTADGNAQAPIITLLNADVDGIEHFKRRTIGAQSSNISQIDHRGCITALAHLYGRDLGMVEAVAFHDGKPFPQIGGERRKFAIYEGIRKTYDGPLAMSDDLTVINVTKDHIEVREVTINHDSWPQGTSKAWDTAPRGEPATGLISDWLDEGKLEGVVPPPKEPIE